RAGDSFVGAPADQLVEFCTSADLMLIRAAALPQWREEYLRVPRRAFIDMDPLFTQIRLVLGHRDLVATVDRCNRLFTIGRRVGSADCVVPLAGRVWHKTLPPVCLEYWPFAAEGEAKFLTSVLRWRSHGEVEYGGRSYGNKNREFSKYVNLPSHVSQP